MQLIESLAAPFQPEKYHDVYQEGLRTLIEAKAKGQDVVVSTPVVQTPPADLMAALKQSLAQKQPHGEKKSLLRVVPKGEKVQAAGSSRSAEEIAPQSRIDRISRIKDAPVDFPPLLTAKASWPPRNFSEKRV